MNDAQPASGRHTGVPTCYRHPDRETYVSCTRCGRPICPDCMHNAAVGHQCPECVRAGSRTVRQARTVLGGRPSDVPLVTRTLLALNVVMYVVELVSPGIVRRLEMWGGGVADGEVYRLITSAFLHLPPTGSSFGIIHILFNMWALWVIGPPLEQILGRLRFLVLYLLSALGGSVLLYLLSPEKAAVGASGAIFGLFAAYFVVGRRLGRETGGILGLILINLVFSFMSPSIAWEGHVGGLITGGAVAVAFAYAPRRQRSVIHIVASLAVLVVLGVAVAAKTAQLTV